MVTQELIAFIQSELRNGSSSEKITQELRAKGWSQQDIIKALSQLSIGMAPAAPQPVVASVQQPYYVSTVLPEKVSAHPGRAEGIVSLIFAAISLLFVPPVFGVVGIILGIRARVKGAKTFGLICIITSSICMVIGMVLGIVVHLLLKDSAASGMIGILFFR